MKQNDNQLRAGVYLSYVNLFLSSLIPMFYTPVMLRMLGQAEYGLYSLSSSAISYLSLLSFGFGSTIIRYVAKYRASGDKESIDKTVGFFLAVFSLMAAVAMICGVVISCNVEPIFHRGLLPTELEKVRILILIMTFNTALSFPLSVFSSVITGYEKYIYRKLVDMLSTVIAPIANLIALYLGFYSVGMAVASTVVQLLMLPLNIGYCICKLRVKPKFSVMPKQLVTEMLSFSVFIFLGTLTDMLFWSTDKVILGMLASSTAVAIYNVGGTFNNMVMNVSTSLSGVLTPRITVMATEKKDLAEFDALMIKVGRIQYIIVALIVSGFVVFGRAFIKLWAGTEYSDAYWVAILTLIPLCVPLIQSTGKSIVIALNKHQFRSIVYLIIAVVNVISTYLIVPYVGIVGAAACSGVSYIVGQGLIMNFFYYKVIGLNIPLFWENIMKMSIVPVIMLTLGLCMLRIISINNWTVFFLGVVAYSCIYGFLMYRFFLNDYERDILRNPLLKIISIILK